MIFQRRTSEMTKIHKFSTFLLISFCLVAVLSLPTTLQPTCCPFHDIINLIPEDKVKNIQNDHLKNDEGFKAAIKFLQSKNWTDLVSEILQTPEYRKFEEMTNKYDINIAYLLKQVRTYINSIKIEGTPTAAPNLKPYLKDIEAIIPIFEITKTLSAQLNNPEFVKIRSNIASKKNQKIAEALHNLPQMVKLRNILKEMEFDVEPYIALIYAFLGWIHP